MYVCTYIGRGSAQIYSTIGDGFTSLIAKPTLGFFKLNRRPEYDTIYTSQASPAYEVYLSLSGEIDLPFQQLIVENAGSALEERSYTRLYESPVRSRTRLDNDTSSKQAIASDF